MTKLLATLVALLLQQALFPAVQTAASAAYADVLTAYNACANGDELSIPAGTATWSSTLTVEKHIWIHGPTNTWTGLTITNYAGLTTKITSSGQMFSVENRTSNGVFRLSHLALDNAGDFDNAGDYPIEINSNTSNTNTPQWFRVDHCFLTNGQYFCTVNGINTWGVFDHNVGVNNDNTFQLNGGSFIWHYPLSTFKATTNATVIEANLFIQSKNSAQGDMNECIMSGHGIVNLVRSNVFDGVAYTLDGQFLPYEHHGAGGAPSGNPPDDTSLRGPPYWEIYSNIFNVATSQRILHIRGGGKGATIHDNIITSSGSLALNKFMELTQDDTVGPATYAGYDQVANLNIWGNVLNGTNVTTYSYSDANDGDFIQTDRDLFMHSPDATSGNISWTGYDGSHDAVFNSGVANTMHPYSMLAYPHPLVTAQDGSGGASVATLGPGVSVLIGVKFQ